MSQSSLLSSRLYSIDIFRAVTMMLMIFVNDLWTLQDIPAWLEHVDAETDGMGLADVVFPAFLFIVGLSIPLAVSAREKAGDSKLQIAQHICLRAFALLVIGVLHVNLESYSESALLPKPVWQILITLAFFLIWLDYSSYTQKVKYILQISGIALLVLMAALFKGGSEENPEWMRFHWWGILGLIGWSYLIVSLIHLWFRGALVSLLWLFGLLLFCAACKLHLLDFLDPLRRYVWINSDGALPALAMAGVVTILYYQRLTTYPDFQKYFIFLATFAAFMFSLGAATRPLWGIRKISASPSWVMICIGISVLTLGLLIWIIDVKKKKEWFKIIAPAGTSTLTCYLLPYFHYALYSIAGISLPIILRTGIVGIIKSLAYAMIIIVITGFLEKRKIRLKI